MFNSKPKHSYVDFFEGVLIGTSLGAITTFLLGTDKGKKMRKDWAHKYQMLEHKIERKIRKVAKSPAAKKIKKIATKVAKKSMAYKAAKKAIRKAKRKVKRRRR